MAVSERSAYDLYLSRKLQQAELCRAKGLAGAFELFRQERLDALASLQPALKDNAATLPDSRVLEGGFTSVRQAMATRLDKNALNTAVREFIDDGRHSGMIAALIDSHGVTGKLQVAENKLKLQQTGRHAPFSMRADCQLTDLHLSWWFR